MRSSPAFLGLPAPLPLRASPPRRARACAPSRTIWHWHVPARHSPACVAAGYPRRENSEARQRDADASGVDSCWDTDAWDTGTASSTPPTGEPGGSSEVVWETVADCQVALPSTNPPIAILHLLGGFGTGGLPSTFYRRLASEIASLASVAVVCAPLPLIPGRDHARAAADAGDKIGDVVGRLRARFGFLHTIAAGHSLGARLQTVRSCSRSNSLVDAGAVLLSFNNYSAEKAMGGIGGGMGRSDFGGVDAQKVAAAAAGVASRLGEALGGVGDVVRDLGAEYGDASRPGEPVGADERTGQRLRDAERVVRGAERRVREAAAAGVLFAESVQEDGEFNPSPAQLLQDVRERYAVECTLVVSFDRDELDCSEEVADAIRDKFGAAGVMRRKLAGTHVTPLTPMIGDEMQSTGNETLDDAIGGAAGRARGEFDALVNTVAAFVRFVLEEKIGMAMLEGGGE